MLVRDVRIQKGQNMTQTTVHLPVDLAEKFRGFRRAATMDEARAQAMREWLEVCGDREDTTGYVVRLPDSVVTKQALFKIPEDLHAQARLVARKLRVSVATLYRFAIEFSVEISEGLIESRKEVK
jgi:hypothetical protein